MITLLISLVEYKCYYSLYVLDEGVFLQEENEEIGDDGGNVTANNTLTHHITTLQPPKRTIMKSGTKTKVKKEDIWSCDSCKIHSDTKNRMCPCPRGGCDAIVIGKKVITTTTEIILTTT